MSQPEWTSKQNLTISNMIPNIAYICEILSLDEESNQDKKLIKSLQQYDMLTDPEKKTSEKNWHNALTNKLTRLKSSRS